MISNRRRVTLRDIGKALGVSHASVSLALRNHPRISMPLRKNIQDKAREMGYNPDPLLNVLADYRRQQSESPVQAAIAWINCWPEPSQLRAYHEFDLYWQGAHECAEKYGYRLEEFIVDQNSPLDRLETTLSARHINGILIPPHRAHPGLDALNWEHFSAVRLGRTVQKPPMHVVSNDQAANAMLAYRKMTEKGYQRIGFVGEDTAARMFAGGFIQAQLQAPKRVHLPLLLLPAGLYGNHEKLILWIKENQPDAIITDFSEIPEMISAAGYGIPDDIALAGLSIVDGKISAGIDQHSREVGRVAMLMLISLINDCAQGVPPVCRQVLVEGSWVDGSSCPPVGSLAAASIRSRECLAQCG